MKIRNGFVSNSSSSSFCIYGTTCETNDFMKILKDKKLIDENIEEFYEVDTYELKLNGLSIYCMEDVDEVYLGRDWCNIKDDETGKEFKEDVQNKINELMPDHKCSTLEEAWRDG